MQKKSSDYLLSKLENAMRGYSNFGIKVKVSEKDKYVLELIKECDIRLTYKDENSKSKKEALNTILNSHIIMGYYSDFKESFDYVFKFIPFEINMIKTIEEFAIKLGAPTMQKKQALQEAEKALKDAQDVLSK